MRRALFAALLLLLAPVAGAKTPSCVVPARIAPAPPETPPPGEVAADRPTDFNLLALSWSPEFCNTRRNDPKQAFQCRDNEFGFIVHGLWPNSLARPHPRYCAPAPALEVATVKRHLCMMPGTVLMQHEWAAHGTCGWQSGAEYLEQTATLWNALTIPDMTKFTGRRATAGQLRDAFVRANPGLPRRAIFVDLGRKQWLREVRLCYDLEFKPAACADGRTGAPDRVAVRVRPVG